MKTKKELTQYIKKIAKLKDINRPILAEKIRIDRDLVDSISFDIFKRDSPFDFFDWMHSRGYRMESFCKIFSEWIFTKDFTFKPKNASPFNDISKVKIIRCKTCGHIMGDYAEVFFYKCRCGREDII